MQGVPLTKAVALVYLISLVFDEVIHLSALTVFSWIDLGEAALS